MRGVLVKFICFLLLASAGQVSVLGANPQQETINIFGENDRAIDCDFEIISTKDHRPLTPERIMNNDELEFRKLPKQQSLAGKNEIYWLRVSILNQSRHSIVLHTARYFDATLYLKNEDGTWETREVGMNTPFYKKNIFAFNILFDLPYTRDTARYILMMRSYLKTGLGFRARSYEDVQQGSMIQFSLYSIFTSVILVVMVYNLMLLARTREKIYTYYTLYLLGIVIYAQLAWGSIQFLIPWLGFDFQYLTLCVMFSTICLLLYTRQFLNTKLLYPVLDKILKGMIVARVGLFCMGYLTKNPLWHDTSVDVAVLLPCLIAGHVSLWNGFRPAGYFLVSFWIVLAGFIFNSLHTEKLTLIPNFIYLLSPRILNFNFIDALLFSYSISAKINELRREKEEEHMITIKYQQLALQASQENEALKDSYSKELEQEVAARTEELTKANLQLENQATELGRMYELLQVDHDKLVHDIDVLREARLMDKNVSFDDFIKTFHSEEVAYNFMAGLKWKGQYKCRKCGYKGFYVVNKFTHTCKCKSCGHKESAIARTLLENVHFPIQKALYLTYLIYNNPKVSPRKVAEEQGLREATCYAFAKKVHEAIALKNNTHLKNENWTKLLV